MKYLNTLIIFMVWGSLYGQNIITVSKVPHLGDYTSLQLAINDASIGDTIYCYPGTYGNITLDKRLTIISSGYEISLNPTLNIELDVANALIGNLSINNGAGNSIIQGFFVSEFNVSNVDGIVIHGNYIDGNVNLSNCANILIQSCFLTSLHGKIELMNSTAFLRNSIVQYSGNVYAIDALSPSVIEISNSVIRERIRMSNSLVKNSIFTYLGGAILSGVNNVFEHNVFSDFFDLGPNNIYSASQNGIFVGWPGNSSYSFDSRFQLLPTSPAVDFGENGIDCGVFDGDLPYKLSGIPDLPLIYELNVPSATGGGNMDVNIKVRSEN